MNMNEFTAEHEEQNTYKRNNHHEATVWQQFHTAAGGLLEAVYAHQGPWRPRLNGHPHDADISHPNQDEASFLALWCKIQVLENTITNPPHQEDGCINPHKEPTKEGNKENHKDKQVWFPRQEFSTQEPFCHSGG